MRKLFVTSDIHSYFDIFYETLINKGFDINNQEHILVVCGDLFDRGNKPKQLINFLLSLPSERTILIKGNHEDELSKLVSKTIHYDMNGWSADELIIYEHNKTLETLGILLDCKPQVVPFLNYEQEIKPKLLSYYELRKRFVDYAEIKINNQNYIFVHGWIPTIIKDNKQFYNPKWRNANYLEWEYARWQNGMQQHFLGLQNPQDTIVCGHWHTSYAHKIKGSCKTEFGEDAIFTPFVEKGIIALDACTAHSKQCNIYIIEEK